MKIHELISDQSLEGISRKLQEAEVKRLDRIPEKAQSGSLFFDLNSLSENRNTKISAIKKANPLAIVTACADLESLDIPIIHIDNPRRAYAEAYSAFCNIDYSRLCIIGVTGTNGKTSTATILKSIFDSVSIKTGFIGTGKIISVNKLLNDVNYSMTSPDPEILYPAIKSIENDGCEIIVMEVSSHSLALEKVFPIPFEVAIFTGLSMEHLDFHGTMERYFKEKEKLIERSKYSIINCDDDWGKILYKKYKDKAESVGIISHADKRAIQIESHGLYGSSYVLKSNNYLTSINVKLPGVHNVYNSMFAFAAAARIGIKPCDIKKTISEINTIDGRCELISSDITVIVDYAHTPFALENLLNTVYSDIIPGQTVTIVFGCGGERDREKRPEMARIAEKYCSKIIVTNDNPRSEDETQIINDIIRGFSKTCYGVIRDRKTAITYAVTHAATGDYVVIAGKGHERYQLDKAGYHSFNEKEIIRDAIKIREAKKNIES